MNVNIGYEALARGLESSESRTLARSILGTADPERIFRREHVLDPGSRQATTGFRVALPEYRRELAVGRAGFG